MIRSHEIQGWVSYKNTYKKYIKNFNNATFLHAGCFKGSGVCYACEVITEYNKDINIICVDSWLDKDMLIRHPSDKGKIKTTYGDYIYNTFLENTDQYKHLLTVVQSDILKSVNNILDNSLSFILLDCCYVSTEHTVSVLEELYTKLKIGGVLVIPKQHKRGTSLDSCNIWARKKGVEPVLQITPESIWQFTKV